MMKNIFLVIAISFGVVFASSCSTGHDFIVINKSQTPILITCIVKREFHEDMFKASLKVLGVLPAKELGNHDAEWKPLNAEQVLTELETRKFTVSLEPESMLRLGSTSNYHGHSSDEEGLDFNYEHINIIGVKGEIELIGRQAQTQFVERDSGNYTITYR